MVGRIIFISILLLSNYVEIVAQKVKELSYPKGYFMFPIRPGQVNHLSGALGDLRANHFHGGIDIKTEQREGLPVYAAADGYVQEIRVTTGGYGNGLYLKHPNGLVTVYGHLRTYEGKIKEYAINKRIEANSFELSIKPEANEIEVKKGEIIAYSGNTGGSGGPHLHFEIRNENNNLLNPLYFDFSEIHDNLPVNIKNLIMRPLNINSSVNGKYGRQYFYPKGQAGKYYLSEKILAKGQVGLELMAFDKMNFNQNNYGISCVEVHVNGREKFYYHLEKIPVEDSKDINVHTDYGLEKITGDKYHRLYLTDGNSQMPIYKVEDSAGKLNVIPGETYNIEVKCWDSYENLSKFSFQLFGDTTSVTSPLTINKKPETADYQIDENTLVISLENCKSPETLCELGVNNKIVPVPLAYIQGSKAMFLYDLRNGLPQYFEINDIQQEFNFKKMIPSNVEYQLQASNYKLNFHTNSLYDSLYLEMYKSNGKYKIGQSTIPLREPIDIQLDNINIANQEQSSVYWIYGNTKRFLRSTWQGNSVNFSTKDLGDFSILLDETAPTIKPLILQEHKLAFRIDDNLSGIKSFKAELNGNFVLMDYDYKKDLIWTVVSDSTANYTGNLLVKVTDNQGNEAVYEKLLDETSFVKPVTATKKTKPKKTVAKKSTKSRKTSVKSKKRR